ncbi:hypothetical protein H6804_00365 [Candidatus Nomurabacteria bacterium]|nr:hypothetical protein [Candidatus Nomurabacteria bacterium]
MKRQPTEEEIQKVIKMLEESNPEKATRENALKVIEGIKTMAGTVVDRIDDDLKSGKVKIEDDGKITREETDKQD